MIRILTKEIEIAFMVIEKYTGQDMRQNSFLHFDRGQTWDLIDYRIDTRRGCDYDEWNLYADRNFVYNEVERFFRTNQSDSLNLTPHEIASEARKEFEKEIDFDPRKRKY